MQVDVRIQELLTPKRICVFFIAVAVYCLLFVIFYNTLVYGKFELYDSFKDTLVGMLSNFVPMLVIATCNVLILFSYPISGIRDKIYLKILVDVLLSFSASLILAYFHQKIIRWLIPDASVDYWGIFLNNVLTLLILEVVYYVVSTREAEKREELVRREAIQYQYDALKAQVNPHFLFNSLNILYSLVSVDTKKSKEFILSLAQMYRYILSHQNMETICLSDELGFVRSYVEILEMRYHEQFSVDITCDPGMESRKIIPYTLQLLIENVTKHNVISTRHPMKVTIRAGAEGVTVTNPVRIRKSDTSTGIGLKYIASHYKLYNKDFEYGSDGRCFTAKVPYL